MKCVGYPSRTWWPRTFSVRTYIGVNKRETVMALQDSDEGSVDRVFEEGLRNAVGVVESGSAAEQVVVVYNGCKDMKKPHDLSWVPAELLHQDGTLTKTGSHNATRNPDRFPRDVIVETGEFVISLRFTGAEEQTLIRKCTLGSAGIIPCLLDDVAISRTFESL